MAETRWCFALIIVRAYMWYWGILCARFSSAWPGLEWHSVEEGSRWWYSEGCQPTVFPRRSRTARIQVQYVVSSPAKYHLLCTAALWLSAGCLWV